MQNRAKVAASAAAIILAALLVGNARGGNAPVSGAQYFSVVLGPWDYVQYTGTSQDAVMLVDDLSFSGRMPTVDVTGTQPPYTMPPPGPYPGPGGSVPLPISAAGTDPVPRIAAFSKIWGLQFGKDAAAEVWEIDGQGARVRQIDRFSHSVRDAIAATFLAGRTPGWRDALLLPGNGEHPMGEDEAEHPTPDQFAMYGWAVPTHGSRHYQSPHIVAFGNRVSHEHPAPAVSQWPYTSPLLFVKGRIVEDGTTAPTEGSYSVANLGITGR